MSEHRAIIRKMRDSIEFIQTKTVEAEIAFAEGFQKHACGKLVLALEDLEKIVNIVNESPNYITNRSELGYKGTTRELIYVVEELGSAWDNIGVCDVLDSLPKRNTHLFSTDTSL